jgi:hypothetical protein
MLPHKILGHSRAIVALTLVRTVAMFVFLSHEIRNIKVWVVLRGDDV